MPQYKVLAGAPPEIYGRDVSKGDKLDLTETQAAHLVQKGQIEAVPEKVAPRGERD